MFDFHPEEYHHSVIYQSIWLMLPVLFFLQANVHFCRTLLKSCKNHLKCPNSFCDLFIIAKLAFQMATYVHILISDFCRTSVSMCDRCAVPKATPVKFEDARIMKLIQAIETTEFMYIHILHCI